MISHKPRRFDPSNKRGVRTMYRPLLYTTYAQTATHQLVGHEKWKFRYVCKQASPLWAMDNANK
jgi:hypothetical protein